MGQGGLGEVEMLSPLRTTVPGTQVRRTSKFSPNFYLVKTRDFNALQVKKFGIRFFACRQFATLKRAATLKVTSILIFRKDLSTGFVERSSALFSLRSWANFVQ
jgi:hypothetical protein